MCLQSRSESAQGARIADGSRYIVPGSQCTVVDWCQSAVPSVVAVGAARMQSKPVYLVPSLKMTRLHVVIFL